MKKLLIFALIIFCNTYAFLHASNVYSDNEKELLYLTLDDALAKLHKLSLKTNDSDIKKFIDKFTYYRLNLLENIFLSNFSTYSICIKTSKKNIKNNVQKIQNLYDKFVFSNEEKEQISLIIQDITQAFTSKKFQEHLIDSQLNYQQNIKNLQKVIIDNNVKTHIFIIYDVRFYRTQYLAQYLKTALENNNISVTIYSQIKGSLAIFASNIASVPPDINAIDKIIIINNYGLEHIVDNQDFSSEFADIRYLLGCINIRSKKSKADIITLNIDPSKREKAYNTIELTNFINFSPAIINLFKQLFPAENEKINSCLSNLNNDILDSILPALETLINILQASLNVYIPRDKYNMIKPKYKEISNLFNQFLISVDKKITNIYEQIALEQYSLAEESLSDIANDIKLIMDNNNLEKVIVLKRVIEDFYEVSNKNFNKITAILSESASSITKLPNTFDAHQKEVLVVYKCSLKRYQHKIEQFIKKLEYYNFKVVRQNILENINKMPVIVLATPELKSATLSNELSFDSLLSNEIYQISKKRVVFISIVNGNSDNSLPFGIANRVTFDHNRISLQVFEDIYQLSSY